MPEEKPDGYQPFPKWKYHRTGRSVVVDNADAEAALGEGWGDSPGGPSGLPPSSDPLRWFDSWDLQDLSAEAALRIKAGLLSIQADIAASSREDGCRIRRESLQKAFDLFAGEHLAVGLLTESVMEESIPQYVYDAAVAGGWQTGTPERNSGCTLRFGHYWVPDQVPKMLRELFDASVWRWRAKLLQTKTAQTERTRMPKAGDGSVTRRYGFEADAARHSAIGESVGRHANWKGGSKNWRSDFLLKSICADLDQTKIDIPKNWRTGRTPSLKGVRLRSWVDALELGYKKLIADQIRYSLDMLRSNEEDDPSAGEEPT